MTPAASVSCAFCGLDGGHGADVCPEIHARRARLADDFSPLPTTGAGLAPHSPHAPVARQSSSSLPSIPASPEPSVEGERRDSSTHAPTTHGQRAEGEGDAARAPPSPVGKKQALTSRAGTVAEVAAAPQTLAYDSPTRAGIVAAQPEDWDELKEAWHHFGRQIESSMWARAAIVARVRRIHGEASIEKFAEEVGQARSTVYRLLQVWDAFPEESRRRDNLTYWHHVEALKAPDPVAALAEAEAEGWSVRDLRKHLAPARSPSEPKRADVVDVPREPVPQRNPAPEASPARALVDAIEEDQRDVDGEAPTDLLALAHYALAVPRRVFTDEWPDGEPVDLLLAEARAFVRDLEKYQAAHS